MQTHTKKCCNPKQILTNIHRLCNRLMADLFHKASLFWKMEVTFVATVSAGNTQNDSEETISSPSCRPLLDCSFKDLNELFQSVEEIIQCFHNPAYTGLHWPLSHTCIFKSVHKRTHTHTHTCCRCSPCYWWPAGKVYECVTVIYCDLRGSVLNRICHVWT